MATNRELNNIINRFNKDFYQQAIKVRLSEHIDYVQYLENGTFKIDSDLLGNDFSRVFLLKHNNQYVGIIQDGGSSDLHIYVQKAYRGQTRLIAELNQTVIPYLLTHTSRKQQDLTFINSKVENHFLNNLNNIVSTDSCMAIIQKKKNNSQFESEMENSLNEKEFNLFKQYIRQIAPLNKKYEMWYKEEKITDYILEEAFITEYDYHEVKDKMSYADYMVMKDEFNYMKRMEDFCIKVCKLVYNDEELYLDLLYEMEILSAQDFESFSHEQLLEKVC